MRTTGPTAMKRAHKANFVYFWGSGMQYRQPLNFKPTVIASGSEYGKGWSYREARGTRAQIGCHKPLLKIQTLCSVGLYSDRTDTRIPETTFSGRRLKLGLPTM